MSSIKTHYSVADIEARILTGIRSAGLYPTKRIKPEALAALDHFHTGGLKASRELLDIVTIKPQDRVLDIGAALGGSARMLSQETGCHVDCLELSRDYCIGARLLNRLTGLEELVEVHQGSALELTFDEASFDLVWMQNVGMNIEDKIRLYTEIARVLKPGGRYVFQEMSSGSIPCCYYPLPWAGQISDSFLISADAMCSLLEECRLSIELFEDISNTHLNGSNTNATPARQGQLGLGIYVDNLAEKASNARRSLEEGQVRLVRGVFLKR